MVALYLLLAHVLSDARESSGFVRDHLVYEDKKKYVDLVGNIGNTSENQSAIDGVELGINTDSAFELSISGDREKECEYVILYPPRMEKMANEIAYEMSCSTALIHSTTGPVKDIDYVFSSFYMFLF